MSKSKNNHLKLLELKGIKPDERIEAINIMSELEEVQGINDDIIESIVRQNEAIEAVIQKLISAAIYYG